MATPLRKDQPEFEDEPDIIDAEIIEEEEEEPITTGDLARAKKPASASETRAAQASAAQSDPLQSSGKVSKISDATPLFPVQELEGLRTRWKAIQTAFVDEPRDAVQQADGLVASAMQRLAEVFATERSKLEQQWDRGDNVSTEDLRVALQRYRTFFERLLSV